jgi:hypothetical protein
MTEPSHRFPAPWHADKIPDGYVVRDANGQSLVGRLNRDQGPGTAIQAKMATRRIRYEIEPDLNMRENVVRSLRA